MRKYDVEAGWEQQDAPVYVTQHMLRLQPCLMCSGLVWCQFHDGGAHSNESLGFFKLSCFPSQNITLTWDLTLFKGSLKNDWHFNCHHPF